MKIQKKTLSALRAERRGGDIFDDIIWLFSFAPGGRLLHYFNSLCTTSKWNLINRQGMFSWECRRHKAQTKENFDTSNSRRTIEDWKNMDMRQPLSLPKVTGHKLNLNIVLKALQNIWQVSYGLGECNLCFLEK